MNASYTERGTPQKSYVRPNLNWIRMRPPRGSYPTDAIADDEIGIMFMATPSVKGLDAWKHHSDTARGSHLNWAKEIHS